jgi:hypothetical protein
LSTKTQKQIASLLLLCIAENYAKLPGIPNDGRGYGRITGKPETTAKIHRSSRRRVQSQRPLHLKHTAPIAPNNRTVRPALLRGQLQLFNLLRDSLDGIAGSIPAAGDRSPES